MIDLLANSTIHNIGTVWKPLVKSIEVEHHLDHPMPEN